VLEVGNPESERAEIFDAMGHPTRITILKLLSREAVSFADLKRKMGIDSSGHLQHHLTKLDGLIKTDEHGNYRLSDTGFDALCSLCKQWRLRLRREDASLHLTMERPECY